VHLYLGDSAPAVSDLEYVALRDSRDAYAAYFYAQALLQSAMSRVRLNKFELVEPSLEEIFIDVVGNHHA